MHEVGTNKAQASVTEVPSPWVNLGQPVPEALMLRGLMGRVKWVFWTRASLRNQGPFHTLILATLSQPV